MDPPLFDDRAGGDRRVADRRRGAASSGPRPADARRVLPAAWCDGWLVFRPVLAPDAADDVASGGVAPHVHPVRRLAPVPADWRTCAEDRLGDYLRAARGGRAASFAAASGTPHARTRAGAGVDTAS